MRCATVLVSTIAIFLMATGCRHAVIRPYHSTASIPRTTVQTSTRMTVVDCEGAKSWRSSEAGVIAAFDSSAGKTLPYVLIAPKMYFGGRKASDIENLNVNAAAVVPHKQLPEVIAGLRKLHDQWTVELPKSIGEFWEFVSIPESDSMPVSDSVLHYRPSLRMAFNRTVGGPNLTVFIAEKDLAFIWIIDEREDLACLVDRLEKAAVLLR